MLKGIAASQGIAVAKVYKLETPNVVIEKKQGDPQAEIKKFDEALEKTKKDIEGVKERAAKRLSPEELAVFYRVSNICWANGAETHQRD